MSTIAKLESELQHFTQQLRDAQGKAPGLESAVAAAGTDDKKRLSATRALRDCRDDCAALEAAIQRTQQAITEAQAAADLEAAQALIARDDPARSRRIGECTKRIVECKSEIERLERENAADIAIQKRDQLSAEVVAAHYGLPSPLRGQPPLLQLVVPHGANDSHEQRDLSFRRSLKAWEERHAHRLTPEAQALIARRDLGDLRTPRERGERPVGGFEDPDLGRAVAEQAAAQAGAALFRNSLGPRE